MSSFCFIRIHKDAIFYFRRLSHRCNELLSLVGLMLIGISVIFFDSSLIPPFPNVYTLIPTCGSALIILCADKNTFIGYILSMRLLRWIGLISYSAYLWHQPILAFLRLYPNEFLDNSISLIVILVVFPLSFLSYYFIEQPFRDKKRFSRQQIFSFAALATLITLFLALFLIRTANTRSLAINQGNDTYLADLRKYGNWEYVVRDFDALAAKKKTFSNPPSKYKGRAVLIGDSFAQDFYNMIIEGKHLTNWDFLVHFVYSRCQIYMADENRLQFIEARHHQTCIKGNHIKNALPIIRQANVIFLVSNWYIWSAQRLPITLQRLNLTKEQQVFVVGPKHFGKVNPILYVNRSKTFRLKQYQYPKIEVLQINELLEKTVDKSIYVNMQKLICKGLNQTCPLFTPEGKLISHDGAHLTKHGARYVGDILFKNKPLNKLKSN